MHRQTIKTFSRITILTLIILVCIRVASAFIDSEELTQENKYNFKSASSSQLGNVGVAVSTNIGIRFKQRQASVSSNGIRLGELSGDAIADRQEILSVNILALRDYNNLIKTDIKELLAESRDRKQTLNSYISQLELRFKNGNANGRNLESQQTKLQADKVLALEGVRRHKSEMAAGLKAHDTDAIVIAMDNYLLETNNYNVAQSNLVFVNYFIRKYREFGSLNKALLDTLINNKLALANGSFVVVPDSGSDLLKDLNLIYNESDFKGKESNTTRSPSPSGLFQASRIEPIEVGSFSTKELILNQQR